MLPRLLVVDRSKFTLDIYTWKLRKRRFQRTADYAVTVGKIGSRTPHGLYFVQGKSRTPDWKVPIDNDYSKELWGHIYKFGEEGNPFAGGFISLSGKAAGVGLHGTSFEPKVGTASSHGCVRMLTPDLLAIYDQCAIGTPVYLH